MVAWRKRFRDQACMGKVELCKVEQIFLLNDYLDFFI